MPKKISTQKLEGTRRRGRPRKGWKEEVERDLQVWRVRFSAPLQNGPGAHKASCAMGTGSFSGVKSGRSVALIPHLLLVPWSRKCRAIPLFPLWAVRPVQNLSACTRVHFTFTLM